MGSLTEVIGGSHYEDTCQDIYVKAGMKIILEAGTQITLKVGGNFVDIGPAGVTIVGTMVLINSGGAPGVGTPQNCVPPEDPDKANTADVADPGSDAPTYKAENRQIPGWKIPTYKHPTHKPNNKKNEDKKSWIALTLVDELGNPVAGQKYRVTLPDGHTLAEGTTDAEGNAKVSNIDPGSCKITFPNLDQDVWDEA